MSYRVAVVGATGAVKALHEAFELGADEVRAEHPFEAAR